VQAAAAEEGGLREALQEGLRRVPARSRAPQSPRGSGERRRRRGRGQLSGRASRRRRRVGGGGAAPGATPCRRRASATRTSSAPRALGAFELDDDAEGDDDDRGAPAPSPPAAGAETQLAVLATPAPAAARVDPRTTRPQTSLPTVPPATPSTPSSFNIPDDDPFWLAAADKASALADQYERDKAAAAAARRQEAEANQASGAPIPPPSPFGKLRPLGAHRPGTACPLDGDQCGSCCGARCRTPPPPPSPSKKSDASGYDSDDNITQPGTDLQEQLDAEQDEDVVKCCMCGRDDDGEYLLCDGLDADGNPCPNEAHTSCVASVPDATDPWYCPACFSQVFVVKDAPHDLGHGQIVVSEACMRMFRLAPYEVVMVKGPTGIGWGEYSVIMGAGSGTHAVGLTGAIRKDLGVRVGGLVVVAPSGTGRDLRADLVAVKRQELSAPAGFKPLRAFKKPDAADAEDPDADDKEESESESSTSGDEIDAHEDAPESEDDDDVVGGGSDDDDDDDDDQGDNGGDEPSAKKAPKKQSSNGLASEHYSVGDEITLENGKIKAIFKGTDGPRKVRVEIIEDEKGPVDASVPDVRQRYGLTRKGEEPKSRFWGVRWTASKNWSAAFNYAPGKPRHVGNFYDDEKAALARDEAVRALGREGQCNMNVDDAGLLVPKPGHVQSETDESESEAGESEANDKAVVISVLRTDIDGYVTQTEAYAARRGETTDECRARVAKEKAARKGGPPPPIDEWPPEPNLDARPQTRDADDSDDDSEPKAKPNDVVVRIHRAVRAEAKKEKPCCYLSGNGWLVVTDRKATAKLFGYSCWDNFRGFFPGFEFKLVVAPGRGEGSWTAYEHEHFRADGAGLELVQRNDEGKRCFTYNNLRTFCSKGCRDVGYGPCGGGICSTSGIVKAYCKLGCEPSEEGKAPCGNAIPRQQLGRLLGVAFSKNHTSEEIREFFGFDSQDLRNVLISGSPYGEDTVQMWQDRLLEVDHIISLKYLREHLGAFVTTDKKPTLYALMASCLINLQLLLRYLNGKKSDEVTDKTLKGIERRYEVLMRAVELTDPSGDGRWICPHPLKKQKKEEEKVYVNIDIFCKLLKQDVAEKGGEIGCEDIQRY